MRKDRPKCVKKARRGRLGGAMTLWFYICKFDKCLIYILTKRHILQPSFKLTPALGRPS